MRVAPHQDPWLLAVMSRPRVGRSDLDAVLTQRAARHTFDRVLVMFGGDHGYWAERRLVHSAGAWWIESDSHRARRPVPRVRADQAAAEKLFARVRKILSAVDAKSIFADEGPKPFLEEPLLGWSSDAARVVGVVRGFGVATMLWDVVRLSDQGLRARSR